MEYKTISCGYFNGWKKLFNFKGIATRKKFLVFLIVTTSTVLLSYLLIVIFAISIFPAGGNINTFVFIYIVFKFYGYILFAVLLLPMLSLGVRRMHDVGISGWWFVCSIIFYFFGLRVVAERLMNIISIYSDKSYSYDVKMTIYLTSNIFTLLLISLLCCQSANSK